MTLSSVITENNLERKISIGYETPPIDYSDEGEGDSDKHYNLYLSLVHQNKVDRRHAMVSLEIYKNALESSMENFLLMAVAYNPNFVRDNIRCEANEELENLSIEELIKMQNERHKELLKGSNLEEYLDPGKYFDIISLLMTKHNGYASEKEELADIKSSVEKIKDYSFFYTQTFYKETDWSKYEGNQEDVEWTEDDPIESDSENTSEENSVLESEPEELADIKKPISALLLKKSKFYKRFGEDNSVYLTMREKLSEPN